MKLKLFNTLTRNVSEFVPINNNEVKLYTCGPTVYNFAHIGNLRTYVFEDVLKRVLIYNNFKVNHVMNITDVGHLTSDQDSGEDKMEKGASRENKTVWDIAEFYTNAFKEDIKKLNIIEPNIWCKATDHIAEQIEMVKTLEQKGFTYKTSDGIYFDTSKLEDYGKLAKLNIEGLRAGARVDLAEKRNPTDFALWKFSNPEDKRAMEWDSPWGKGFPGWHIECSAMAMKYLGETFDIHCGGIDHITVHHTNEIAQAEATTGKKFVNYWLHGEFLRLDNEKMAKSGDNFITLKTVIDKGFSPLDYRYLNFTSHYRSTLTFTWENLMAARTAHQKLINAVIELKKKNDSNNHEKIKVYKHDFKNIINNDLDMPNAVALIWNMLKDQEIGSVEKYQLLLDFDLVLGLDLINSKEEEIILTTEQTELLKLRENARLNKDFKESDRIRDIFKSLGLTIKDTKEGQKIIKE